MDIFNHYDECVVKELLSPYLDWYPTIGEADFEHEKDLASRVLKEVQPLITAHSSLAFTKNIIFYSSFI